MTINQSIVIAFIAAFYLSLQLASSFTSDTDEAEVNFSNNLMKLAESIF